MTEKEFMKLIVSDLQKLGYWASVQELRPNLLPPFVNIVAPDGGHFYLTVSPKGFKLQLAEEFYPLLGEISHPLELIAPKIHQLITKGVTE